ncbi:MAG: helix-turn-helix transcriptional regulator [Oscillospiraceae bacterium]|nr:helix-turn-helix transcriptional regulator [Oscillospiraceae bacterium]
MREWLRAIREELGYTQKYVAEKSGISQPSYFNIERGERGIAVSTAKAIAAVLGFDWTRFYDEEDVNEQT